MKQRYIWSFVSILVVLGGYFITKPTAQKDISPISQDAVNNVTESDGKQYVEVRAKGGYFPKVSTVKAGVPTVLRLRTEGTFDCSSQVRIPSLNVAQSLAISGITEVDLGVLKPGTLSGTCSMGMYSFEIRAE